MQRVIEQKTEDARRASGSAVAAGLVGPTWRDWDKFNAHVEKRRRALTRIQVSRRRMNDLIAGYRQAWGVDPPFAPQPIAIDLAPEDESEDED